MPVTFQVVGNLADFGNNVRAGVMVRATATPGVKVGDVAVHSNEPETDDTDTAGAFTLELVSLPGVWYRIQTPYSNAMNTVRLAGYIPDVDDPTTGVVFPPGTVIDLKDVLDEDPTPGYEGLVYSGPPNVLTKGTITTGEPGTDAEFTIEGTSPSQVLSFVIPRGVPGADSTVPGPASTVPGPPNVLTIGTVTASAPGSDADADIGGVSPNQTLDLVIPRGLTGPQGETRYLVQDGAAYPARPFPVEVPVTFVGSANPDTLGVMVVGDSWINTAADAVVPYVKHYDGAGSPEGVVTAQIGSRYIDVNATRGAVEWIKMSGSGNTGWKVTEGDTGSRSLIDGSRQLLNNISGWRIDVGGANRSTLHIRRINEMVHINLWELYPPAGSTTYWGTTQPRQGGITSIPHGFRGFSIVGWSTQACLASWNSASYQSQNVLGTIYPAYGNFNLDGWPDTNVLTVGQPSGATTANWQVSGYMVFRTNDPWPTTLPGTAAS